jgi:hypothetical protein
MFGSLPTCGSLQDDMATVSCGQDSPVELDLYPGLYAGSEEDKIAAMTAETHDRRVMRFLRRNDQQAQIAHPDLFPGGAGGKHGVVRSDQGGKREGHDLSRWCCGS